MKDYTFEINDKQKRKEEQDKFILSYEIKNEKNKNCKKKIIIYMANNKKVVFDYTKELEESILDLMKNNALNYEKIFSKAHNRKKERDAFIEAINVGVVSIVSLLFFILFSCGVITTPIIIIFFMLLSAIILTSSLYKTSCDNKYRDFEKTMLFLENEERINKYSLNNSKSLEKNKKEINNDNCSKQYTNSIDKMSLKDLKNLLSAIEKEEIASIECENQKVLKKI